MATEFHTTRSHRITMEGHTITVILTATWAEWDAQGVDIPRIGDAYSDDRQDLRCTDISVDAFDTDNTNCRIVALYSTEGEEYRKRRENEITSWESELDISVEQYQSDVYYDHNSSTWKKWEASWVSGGGTADKMPTLYLYKPTGTFSLTAYGDTAVLNRVIAATGKINSNNHLAYVSAKKSSADTSYNDDSAAASDIGKWLFIGARVTRVRTNCWKIEMRFVWNKDGWNTYEGVTTYAYETTDFSTLLTGMTNISDEEDVGLYS